MPEITLPEVKLPDIKLPEGLREMTKDDIVQAAKDVKLPKQLKMPEIDLSDVELPEAIAERMPGRRRTNPLIPIFGVAFVAAALAALWWLIASPSTGPRVRRAMDDLRNRMSGESTDLIRYDDETDLGSLVGHGDVASRTPQPTDPYGMGDIGLGSDAGVAVGPGTHADAEARAPLA